MRVGCGYDSHRLVAGRKLVLGGVEIPFTKGLQGHSDADVLVHAICDALLGAAGSGDLGRHFPDSDPAFKDVSSLILLKQSNHIIMQKGMKINNIDATVVLEQPKLQPHGEAMAMTLAATLDIERSRINIKATTNEGMGFTGRGEGIAAFAVVSLTEAEGMRDR